MPSKPTFGDRVEEALKLRGMRAADLARALNRKPAIVSHWLTGKRNCPDATVVEIARILRVNRRWLVSGGGTPETVQPKEATNMSGGSATITTELPAVDWHFRHAPQDGGRDFGNANA